MQIIEFFSPRYVGAVVERSAHRSETRLKWFRFELYLTRTWAHMLPPSKRNELAAIDAANRHISIHFRFDYQRDMCSEWNEFHFRFHTN